VIERKWSLRRSAKLRADHSSTNLDPMTPGENRTKFASSPGTAFLPSRSSKYAPEIAKRGV
jgi:hypothetical protein